MEKELKFDYNNRKVERIFNEDWSNSGIINIDKIPDIIKSLVIQRKEMVKYISLLQDKIDSLIIHNKICNCPSCHTAGCTSDHK